MGGKQIEVDSRPSDAVALAVRTKAPIFVAETVMERHAIQPEEDVERALGEATKDENSTKIV